jgi:hypothetical protein
MGADPGLQDPGCCVVCRDCNVRPTISELSADVPQIAESSSRGILFVLCRSRVHKVNSPSDSQLAIATRFTEAERALLARKAKAVGRKALLELDTIVSPDTLLRWHRRFVAQKWNFAVRRGAGRPGIMRQISELIVRMAQENPSWGFTPLREASAHLTTLVRLAQAGGVQSVVAHNDGDNSSTVKTVTSLRQHARAPPAAAHWPPPRDARDGRPPSHCG